MLDIVVSAFADVCFFFFQAEDGIRDLTVTGVQTCALPICDPLYLSTSSRASTTRMLRSTPLSRSTIAVISLVIEAIGTTASLFLLITTSPVSASCTSTAEDLSRTTFCARGAALTSPACANPTVRASTRKSANRATIPSRGCSLLCMMVKYTLRQKKNRKEIHGIGK